MADIGEFLHQFSDLAEDFNPPPGVLEQLTVEFSSRAQTDRGTYVRSVTIYTVWCENCLSSNRHHEEFHRLSNLAAAQLRKIRKQAREVNRLRKA